MSNTTRAILSLRLTVDHIDRDTPVYSYIKLYREDGALIWRIDGPRGDECETLPRPATVAQAKDDARAVYRSASTWEPADSWL